MEEFGKRFDATCYVTVAVTVKNVRADSARHAAMSAGVALSEWLDGGQVCLGDGAGSALRTLTVAGRPHHVTHECDGSDIDGFLIEDAGGGNRARLGRNGIPV